MAISGNQWQSVVPVSDTLVLASIRGNQWQSVAISGNQWQSVVPVSDALVLASIRGGSPSAPKAQPADARGIGGVVELLEQGSLDPDGDAHHLMEGRNQELIRNHQGSLEPDGVRIT